MSYQMNQIVALRKKISFSSNGNILCTPVFTLCTKERLLGHLIFSCKKLKS